MTTQSVWAADAVPHFPRLDRDLEVDVAVIGGGITGVTAAYLLRKAGKSVALLERDQCGGGNTQWSTAHLTYVTDLGISELVSKFGRDHARAAWDAGRAAIGQVHDLSHAENIDCGFAWVPNHVHAPVGSDPAKEADDLRAEADLAAELGFDATFVDAVPVVGTPGVRFADQAEFDPLQYIGGLLAAFVAQGGRVFEGTDVTGVTDDPLTLTANGRKVTCGYLVLATHVPLMGVTGVARAAVFQTKLAGYTSYVVGARLPRGTIDPVLLSDTDDPYLYFRADRRADHDAVLLGGEDHKTGQEPDPAARWAELEKRLAVYAPGAEVTHRWSGQVIAAADGLPYIGEIADKQFIGTGYGGNGTTFGTLAGMMAADAALGNKNPWADLFRPGRSAVAGAVDYVKENLTYPYYMARDRVRASEGTSLADLGPGEGKILRLNGAKVAAYRDGHGAVTTLSPVCTHMGCLVRWNPGETTWDCPCHGSRFKPTGEVLAGPAEAPLPPAEQQADKVQ